LPCCAALGPASNDRPRYCGFRLLAARAGSFDLSPPIDDFPKQYRIYDAIRANDFDRALRIVTADPDEVECPEGIPPPLEYCGDEDKPEWIEWLLDHGADIERLNHDYGSTALICAVIRRQKRAIRTLVKRGADATEAMDRAQQGLTGAYEDDPSLDREGYPEIIELLRELGLG
jgi:ankyrin repeat protein